MTLEPLVSKLVSWERRFKPWIVLPLTVSAWQPEPKFVLLTVNVWLEYMHCALLWCASRRSSATTSTKRSGALRKDAVAVMVVGCEHVMVQKIVAALPAALYEWMCCFLRGDELPQKCDRAPARMGVALAL